MNQKTDCCLTLVCHKSLEERLVDQLLQHPQWVAGFTVGQLDGHRSIFTKLLLIKVHFQSSYQLFPAVTY